MPRKKPDAPAKGTWTVTLRCVVTKEVTCEGCTEDEARNNPWDHAVSEIEVEQVDWEVTRVGRED